jgi:hypothetical protein
MGKNSTSFRDGHADYGTGLGYVDINTVDYGDEVFSGKAFNQHLSVYDGLTTITGNGLKARVLAWTDGDVIATELDDQRTIPSAVNIDLRMLRYSIHYIDGKTMEDTQNHTIRIKQGAHTSTSRFEIRDGKIILIQEFVEGDYYCASAVAIGVVGRKSKADYYNESTVRLSTEPGKGVFTILTASAASFDPKEDIAQLALKQLEAAQPKTFNGLLQENRAWWATFWPKSVIRLHSADNVADEMEKKLTYYQYVMASCSRGEYMPGFRGMLWYTNGDLSQWGSQYWWHNQGTYFNGLTPLNRPELLAPVFKTYSKHYDSYATAAEQQWGSKGIFIPETGWFDGMEVLPDSIAEELRDLYLMKKKWEDRSKAFDDFAETKNDMNSRWNFLFLRRSFKNGEVGYPFAWVTHILASTAKISYLYWLNYEYYLDKEWLRETAYPMIKGTVEFYSHFPNLYKEADGKYHIHYVNNWESDWGKHDAPEELLSIRALFPIAMRASEILGVDADRRPVWKEILDHLTPLPASATYAEWYDYIHVGNKDSQLFKATLEAYRKRTPNPAEVRGLGNLSRMAVGAAHLGLADDIKYLIPNQMSGNRSMPQNTQNASAVNLRGPFRNLLSLGEGAGAIECERLGLASQATCTALLQSVPASPDGESVNYIFPAWPKEWDAQFTLAARNAFVISASQVNGKVEFVEIQSTKGGKCLVQNPWGTDELTVYRNGKKSKNISGKLLTLPTKSGEVLTLVPKGEKLPSKNI